MPEKERFLLVQAAHRLFAHKLMHDHMPTRNNMGYKILHSIQL